MKINVEIDCTPDEARRCMGLPDMEQMNALYMDALNKTMQGFSSAEQLEYFTKNLAPMGEFGMKMFENMMNTGFGGGFGDSASTAAEKSDKPRK